MSIITVDYLAHNYPSITRVEGLPFDSLSLLAAPSPYGGVIIRTANAILHVDQASRIVALPLSGWASRITKLPAILQQPAPSDDQVRAVDLDLHLEGAQLLFVSPSPASPILLLALSNGDMYTISVVMDGRTISRLSINDNAPIARGPPPAVLTQVAALSGATSDDLLFLGSTAGPALLLGTSWRARIIAEPTGSGSGAQTAPPISTHEDIDLDEGKSPATKENHCQTPCS